MKLGELKRIDLRVGWQHEESDFTPWMKDRIDLLAETLGLEDDLEVESREEPIGRYRADLICSSQAGRVLVENQLGETDHSHLGQVLAYAAGVEATVVVWVAASFTEEHRAAIDWLNSITDGVDFFGLEIELWQIGDSDPAPKFNVVSKPNDWSRSVATQAREVTPLGQMQLEYWTKFRDVLLESNGSARASKPAARHWYSVPVGRGGFNLSAIADTKGGRIRAEMYIQIGTPLATSRRSGRTVTTSSLTSGLIWIGSHCTGRRRVESPSQRISIPRTNPPGPEQHRWLADRLNRMHEILAPRVSDLEPIPASHDDSGGG